MPEVAVETGRPESDVVEREPKPWARSDRRMAELALAMELQLADPDELESKWPMGTALAFAVSASMALWLVIGLLAYFVI